MAPAPRPQWQQATALITIGAGSIATGLTFVPKAAADLTTPASIPPVTLLALEHANAPAPGRDAMLRAAIVHMARHFLRLAETRSPAEMEALIWQHASTDGANHGPSCAAFASLTLELGSHIAGMDSWVTGGTSYPWPVHSWVDGRVDPNPASPGVVSILQDARSHGRWHELGDGYTPQPGDWVLFDGHVEVVTKYHGGVLHTIGGDSLPNLSVNGHEYAGQLQNQGVAGFVDNGVGMSNAPGGAGAGGGGHGARAARTARSPRAVPMASADPTPSGGAPSSADPVPGGPAPSASPGGTASGGGAPSAGPVTAADAAAGQPELAPRAIAVPRTVPRSRYAASQRPPLAGPSPHQADHGPPHGGRGAQRAGRRGAMTADVPATGLRPARPHHARPGEAAIPGLFKGAHRHHPADGAALAPYHRHDVPPSDAPLPGTAAQQAFIKEVASGAMATQRRYGVPASVTIAQAIDESGWGQSVLATSDHNLFGIKGTGPAGSDEQPTQEVINGQLVSLSASFQIYQNLAQSIDAHGRLLSHSGDYAGAMSRSKDPNAFAAALTGIYATDPGYGAKLVQLMKQYDLYRFDRAATPGDASGGGGGAAAAHELAPAARKSGTRQASGTHHPARTPPPASPGPRRPSPGRDRTPTPQRPGPVGNPVPEQPAPVAEPVAGQPAPIAHPVPGQPGPMARPPARAHDADPATGAKTGASVPARRARGARPGRAADHAQVVQHDAATPPAATLYPGRSARPAPLAHPARPTDLARPSSAAPSRGSGISPAPAPAQQPGLWPDPAPSTGHGTAGTGNGLAAGRTSPEAAAGAHSAPVPGPDAAPTAGAGLAQVNVPGGAAIPGVPHAVAAPAGRAHARRPVGRLRPAHPAGRITARAPHAGPAAPGNAAANSAATGAAAPAVRPTESGPDPVQTPHVIIPAASAPTGRQAGGAMIPGTQHHGLAAHPPAGQAGGAAAPDSGGTATAQPGGSSIPGAQPGAAATAESRGAQAGTRAGAPGRSPAGQGEPGPARRNPPAAPMGQPVSPGRAEAGHAAVSPRTPAGRAHPATAPGRPAAPSASPAGARSHPAAGRGQPAGPGGAPQPPAGRAPGAPAAGSANPGSAAASPVAPPARPAPATAHPLPTAASPVPSAAPSPAQRRADVPGLAHAAPATAARVPAGARFNGGAAGGAATPGSASRVPGQAPANSPAPSAGATLTVYHAHMPPSVREAFVTSARTPLVRAEPLYRDVAGHMGIRWEILAACDWMQCKARHGYSPVYGEKLGAVNPDDTCYRTKSAALEQCASDLVQLARSVYQLDIVTGRELTVRDLASVFAAYRWGGLLRQHCTSAMDFPYSVAGLTADHTHMRWPNIDEPNAPDRPGSRFRQPFGAVPVLLGLNYQALV